MLTTNTMRYGTDDFSFSPSLACITSDGVYGVVNNILVKIANNWDSLTEPERLIALKKIDGILTIEHMRTFDKFRLIAFKDDNAESECIMNAIKHSPQIVKPKGLTSFMEYNCIKKFSLSSNITPNATVKIAATNDLSFYYTYNFSLNKWIEIDINDENVFLQNGIPNNRLEDIPSNAWQLMASANKIAFAYIISVTNVKETCEINNIQATVKSQGKWEQAIENEDYKLEYPNSKTVRVNIIQNGTYKTEYNP